MNYQGFRGLLTILGTWAMILGDTFFTQVSGVSPVELKVAFMASIPITIKLLWIDAKPRLTALFADKFGEKPDG